MTIDVDVFIRSDNRYPNMLPNPLTKSRHQTALGLTATDPTQPVLGVYAGGGTWQYWDRDKYVNSNTKIAYDVWNHLQMAFDTATGTYQVVVQPVGEVPTRVVKGVRAVATKDVRFVISPSNSADHTSLYDNLLIATRPK